MPSRSKRVFLGKYGFVVDENVYEPAEDSFLFAENLDVNAGTRVLDMGTGCGILGIVAAKKASWVVAVDVNRDAVRCAQENATLNDVRGKMVFVTGDLFSPLGDDVEFDVILFNAPYVPTAKDEEDSLLARAWRGGETGRVVIDRFIGEAPKHLRVGGRVLLLQSTLAGVDETLKAFEALGMRARVVAQCRVAFFETIVLVEAKTA